MHNKRYIPLDLLQRYVSMKMAQLFAFSDHTCGWCRRAELVSLELEPPTEPKLTLESLLLLAWDWWAEWWAQAGQKTPSGSLFLELDSSGVISSSSSSGFCRKGWRQLKHYLKKTLHDTLFLGWTVVVYVLTYTIQFSFKLQTLFAMQVSGHHQIWGQLFAGASFFTKYMFPKGSWTKTNIIMWNHLSS